MAAVSGLTGTGIGVEAEDVVQGKEAVGVVGVDGWLGPGTLSKCCNCDT